MEFNFAQTLVKNLSHFQNYYLQNRKKNPKATTQILTTERKLFTGIVKMNYFTFDL